MSKRLLIFSPFFFPELISTGKYNTELVKNLINNDVSVDVVTSFPLYPEWKPKYCSDTLDGVTVYRGGLHVKYSNKTVIRRFILELWFFWYCARVLLKFRRQYDYDIVVPIFPPNIFMFVVNYILPKSTSKVCIIHDLQGIMASSTKNKWRAVVSKLIFYIERAAINKCEKVICLSHSMKDVLIEKYGITAKKCSVHYPFPTINMTSSVGSGLKDILPDNIINVVYAGALGEKQKPKELLEIFRLLASTNNNVACHIFSKGPHFDSIVNEYLKSTSQEKVYFHDLIPTEQLPELYQRSTIQIVPQTEGVGAGAFPSKLPNILKAGVPVFAICDKNSELVSVLNRTFASKVVNNWEKSFVVCELNHFITDVSGQSHKNIRMMNSEFLDQNFNINNLTHDILSVRQI